MLEHIFHEAPQRGDAARTNDKTAMQTDGHHLRRALLAFLVERIERILQVSIELVARIETCGVAKRMSLASSV